MAYLDLPNKRFKHFSISSNVKIFVFLAFVLLVFPVKSLRAEDNDATSVSKKFLDALKTRSTEEITTFIPPKPHRIFGPTYPLKAKQNGEEGWVIVNFMVDTHGKPYEISVVEYSDKDFINRTLEAVEKWEFEPALFEGKPIDAAFTQRIGFRFEEDSRSYITSRQVNSIFGSIVTAINEKDREEASDRLNEFYKKKKTLYEESFYWLARYYFAAAWLDTEEQYRVLNRALFKTDSGAYYLPEKGVPRLLLSKLNLEVKRNYLSRALDTAAQLNDYDLSPKQLQYIVETTKQILETRSGTGLIVVKGKIDKANSFYHSLLRSRFSFSEVEGDIAELRLRCEKGYVGFVYKEEITFEVDGEAGNCSLQVIGDPDTTFKLLEL